MHSFIYEEMVGSPKPFVDCLASHTGIGEVELPQSPNAVQREESTEEWLRRLREDVAKNGVVGHSAPSRPPKRTLGNLRRLFQGRHLKPYPYFC